ncbi:MAG: phosphoenolpyruvate carboxykinase (ATP), partial [bacterium]
DSATIIREIARDTIKWKTDPLWGYEIPEYIPEIDIDRFDFKKHYSQGEYLALVEKLKRERKEWLKQFPDLEKPIIEWLI